MSPSSTAGSLLLVATPIGNLGDLSSRALEVLQTADVVCCEDTRRTGRLLALVGIRARRLVSLHAHNEQSRLDELVSLLQGGATIALVSDAGTPLVSDPGELLVRAAISCGANVSALPGPFAGVVALVLSGFFASRFRFDGFLPRRGRDRERALREIAVSAVPVVIYESPTRVVSTLQDLLLSCGGDRRVAVCRELTKLHEEVRRLSLSESVEAVQASSPRGEYVVVVDAAPEAEKLVDDDLVEKVARLVEAGLDKREAVVAVQLLLGVKHRVAYDAAIHADQEVLRRSPQH